MFDEKLIVVSGKGGVGKTAIATAIAAANAHRQRTVLVSFDPGLERHPFLDVPLGYEPVEAFPGLSVLKVEGLAAIREYVRRKVPFSALYDAFLTSRMFRDFAEAAPGFEELMCLGKLYDLVTESTFEKVVFDAPSTGHFKMLMDVPAATLKTVLVGPLNHNARKIQDLLLDPERTRVVLAALPEEMSIREAVDLKAFCRERRMGVGPVIVNQLVPHRFTPGEIASLKGLADPSAGVRGAITSALAEHETAISQRSALAPLDAEGGAQVLVPRCIDHEPEALIDRIGATLAEAT